MRILLVEDEKSVASFIKRGLKAADYTVDIAEDGDKGYLFAVDNEYDLILLDVGLPKIGGYDLCKKIREKEVTAPIIMLSGSYTGCEDIVKGLDTGADDYLIKPFNFKELLARTRANIRRKYNTNNPTALKVMDLSIDLVAHKVSRAGKEINLTSKEFSLLEYLMMNCNKVVTRAMILEHVWEHDFDSFSNIVDVLINRIREKVDSGYKYKLIHTIRDKGYIIKDSKYKSV
ncbi:MAG: response regulator transcription factor [Elusimicrobia bacterium]|nr:response regulator transcription factor [Candidatus Liberimonas magnetica]